MSANKHITLLKMKNALKRVMKDKLDFKYDSEHGCFYIRDGCPSCLIGCALYDIGIPKKALKLLDSGNPLYNVPYDTSDDGFQLVLLQYGWSIDAKAVELATYAQLYQDNSCTWETAYKNACNDVS